MLRKIDYSRDIHDKNAKVADHMKSYGSKKEIMKIMEGLVARDYGTEWKFYF